MITVEQVLHNLHMQLHPSGECKRRFCSHRGQAAKLAPLVHDMIKEACAETAEDTRERMVAAAGRAVERERVVDSLAAVRELHSAKQVPRPSHFTTWCDECQSSWPCHTAAILEGMVP